MTSGERLVGAKASTDKIAYLLHSFPRITDTFIMREVRALQKAGTDVQIISLWKPSQSDMDAEVIEEWVHRTHFLLPESALSVARTMLTVLFRSPIRLIAVLRLALATSRPGLKGLIYQLFYFAEAILATDALTQNGISHVHNHFGDHSGLITMLAAKLAGITYSISFHGPHVFFDGKAGGIKEKVANAKFIRCISYFCRSQVILFSEITDLSSLKIVHCGLEMEAYQYRPPREKVEKIYCAARLAPEKGFEFLFEAIKSLKDRQYNFQVRLVGDGPSRGVLEQKAEQLGILDRIFFLGYVDEATKMRELCSSDLFVLPSLAEGLPSSATEAMAVGVPVITTNIAGTSELIENGVTGLLVRPSDPDALADAIVRMIDDYKFRTRAAELGRQKVEEEFDVEKEAAKLRRYLLQDFT